MNSLLVNVFSVYCLLHTSFVCCNSNDVNNDKDWWKHVIVYQIYPRSFQDSNGDGVGDIPGITSRLDYLKDLGIGAIWLSPFYESPMADFGYDVSNHTNIDPVFGTLDDFDVLVNEAHKRGIKIIADFIPNHTSDRHPWFIESRRGTDNHYSDYYMWHKGKVSPDGTRQPPNNWLSHFGGSAWTWDDVRGEYYLHQFAVEQPDLNYYKAEVRQDMMEVIQFWLNRDVDGFRVDAISTLFEDKLLRDEPVRSGSEYSPIEHNYLDHIYTVFSDEIHEVTKEWRSVMEENDKKTNKHTYMVMEVYDKTLEYTMKYYDSGADQPFNFGLVYLNEECGGKCVHKLVDSWFQKMPEGKWASFVLGNHDQKRITTRKGVPYIDALNILLLTLPGQPTTYYGEELGMLDIDVTFEQTQDPAGKNVGPELYTKYSRDPCRSPMQWDDGINAGFSIASTTWLPVHPTYNVLNVKNQQATPHSHYHVYKAAVALRQKPAFQSRHIFYSKIDDNIFSYLRFDDDKSEIYWVILNVGTSDAAVNKGDVISFDNVRYAKGDVILTTGSIAPSPLFSIGSTLNLEVNNFTLAPGDGVVLKLIPSLSSHDEL